MPPTSEGDLARIELGLETELEGSLLIVEEPGAATTASGELELVSGTFQAYGQDLVIDSGRLFFAGGPLTDRDGDRGSRLLRRRLPLRVRVNKALVRTMTSAALTDLLAADTARPGDRVSCKVTPTGVKSAGPAAEAMLMEAP